MQDQNWGSCMVLFTANIIDTNLLLLPRWFSVWLDRRAWFLRAELCFCTCTYTSAVFWMEDSWRALQHKRGSMLHYLSLPRKCSAESANLWSASMSSDTTPTHPATIPQSSHTRQGVAAAAAAAAVAGAAAAAATVASDVRALPGSGTFQSTGKAGHAEASKPEARTKPRFFSLVCWGTRTTRWWGSGGTVLVLRHSTPHISTGATGTVVDIGGRGPRRRGASSQTAEQQNCGPPGCKEAGSWFTCSQKNPRRSHRISRSWWHECSEGKIHGWKATPLRWRRWIDCRSPTHALWLTHVVLVVLLPFEQLCQFNLVGCCNRASQWTRFPLPFNITEITEFFWFFFSS